MPRPDKLTLVLGLPAVLAFLLPALVFRPNRIAAGEARYLHEVAGQTGALSIAAGLVLAVVLLLFLRSPGLRALVAALLLAAVLWGLGEGASLLVADAGNAARAGPGSGFWLLFACVALLLVDALARLNAGPLTRAAILASAVLASWLILWSGVFSDLSLAAEFRNREASFWRAGRDHLMLAFGSFAAACAVGIPLGLLLHRFSRPREAVLNILTLVQTIPSIALFGILILPLGWVAANLPGAAAIGIRGIGMAPAMVALFLYSLLPIVANTVAGLAGVSRSVSEAALAMGLTPAQRLWKVKIPLALPVILAGARIVLVQNIGLATVGALIGAGGFGTFVFQGIGQTATDLILLGVLPTVALAFVTSAVMDLLIDILPGHGAELPS